MNNWRLSSLRKDKNVSENFITLVDTNSLKDIFSVKQTSQILKKSSNNGKVIQSCRLRDVSLIIRSQS